MTRAYRCFVCLFIVGAPSRGFSQQTRVPTVPITAVSATSSERFSATVSVRGLSDGSAVVVDAAPASRRMVLLNASLGLARVIMDSAAMNLGVNSAIPFSGDSTVIVEMSSQSMLVLDHNGSVARVMAAPKAQDIFLLNGNITYGAPGFDALGRLIYRANYRRMPAPNANGQMMMPTPPETAPIVRGNFETRTVDTIGEVGLQVIAKMMGGPFPVGTPQSQIKALIDPMATGDEWTVMADGSVAVVRWVDYHVDWIDASGAKRSTPKLLFDWRKVTDEEKQFKTDSVRNWVDSMIKLDMSRPLPPGMQRQSPPQFEFLSFDQMPTYHPPIRPGSVRADRDNNLWILPTTSADAKGGLLYDVVNREGVLFSRVQLPAGAVVAGFGKGGVVYLLQPAGDNRWSLGRAKVTFGGR